MSPVQCLIRVGEHGYVSECEFRFDGEIVVDNVGVTFFGDYNNAPVIEFFTLIQAEIIKEYLKGSYPGKEITIVEVGG